MSEYMLMMVAAIIAVCVVVQFTREIRPSLAQSHPDDYDDYDR